MDLGQLLYISDAKAGTTKSTLDTIREASVRNNSLRNITGILFYSNGHFVQFLEGDPAEVRALFEIILEDTRHDYVKLLYQRPARERLFEDWDMAVLDLGEHDLVARQDLNDLVHLAGYQALDEFDEPMDLMILRRFSAMLSA